MATGLAKRMDAEKNFVKDAVKNLHKARFDLYEAAKHVKKLSEMRLPDATISDSKAVRELMKNTKSASIKAEKWLDEALKSIRRVVGDENKIERIAANVKETVSQSGGQLTSDEMQTISYLKQQSGGLVNSVDLLNGIRQWCANLAENNSPTALSRLLNAEKYLRLISNLAQEFEHFQNELANLFNIFNQKRI